MSDISPFSVMAIVVCSLAAITDIRHGLIPNWLTLPVIVGAPLLHGLHAGPGALLRSLLSLLLCALAPYILFRRGGMGGGDVKLYAALGALRGATFGFQVELVSMLVACLWAFGVLAYRGQLLSVLLRSAQVFVGGSLPLLPKLPKRCRVAETKEHALEVRLGAPIAIAVLGGVAFEGAAWLEVLS